MSNRQDLAVVFYALALAVLGNGLLWAVAAAFVRLLERRTPEFPPAPHSRRLDRSRRRESPLSRVQALSRSASR